MQLIIYIRCAVSVYSKTRITLCDNVRPNISMSKEHLFWWRSYLEVYLRTTTIILK
jgi:hypothetical protein